MKKTVIFLFVITIIILISQNKEQNYIINKDNSIRFRIIASSNEIESQALKNDIKNDILEEIKYIENNSTTINSARLNIKKELPLIENKLAKYNIPYQINFGQNYFPQKEYMGYFYPEDNYESLVIKLGEASGDNWWCILFPPLCLIEAQKDSLSDVQYDFYIKKILNNY